MARSMPCQHCASACARSCRPANAPASHRAWLARRPTDSDQRPDRRRRRAHHSRVANLCQSHTESIRYLSGAPGKQRRHRLCKVEYLGIRRRSQYVQRGVRCYPQPLGSVAFRGGLLWWRRRVALATGMAWVAHGSDMGGSLRNPASFCGVVGLRPSIGRVARTPVAKIDRTLSVQGPMARNVAALALLLDAMSGQNPSRSVVTAGVRGVIP